MSLAAASQARFAHGPSLPDLAACLALAQEHRMLDNIRRHSLAVCRIALLLARDLNRTCPDSALLSLSLVRAGALLHDIGKTPCLDTACDHAHYGAALCLERGWPDIADIVACHVILPAFDEDRYARGRFLAREIVYYADKRVNHEEIVCLEERRDYIIGRYGRNDPRILEAIRANFFQCQRLESFFFTRLPYFPEDVARLVSSMETIEKNCLDSSEKNPYQ